MTSSGKQPMAWQNAMNDHADMAKTKRPEAFSEVQRQIGERIEWARELVYPNQSELARLVGVDPSTLSKHESGERAPSVFLVIALANRLRVSTDYILRGTLDEATDREMALALAARHPELVLGRTDTADGTDMGQAAGIGPAPRKPVLA